MKQRKVIINIFKIFVIFFFYLDKDIQTNQYVNLVQNRKRNFKK